MTTTPTPITLQDRLDMLPRDRHVRLYRYGPARDWYATWQHNARPSTLRLGQDENRLIASLIAREAVTSALPKRTPPESARCPEHDLTVQLWCEHCIKAAKVRMLTRKTGAA
jgi:hypothetical protein